MAKRIYYPFINLREAVERVTDLRTKLGNGPYKTGAVLSALGYKGPSGASGRTLASLSYYGLLSKTSGGYELSPLATRIVRPVSDPDKNAAVLEAVQRPKLFSALLDTYNGEQMPSMLDNYLIHNFEMTDAGAKKASNVFKKSLKYAGAVGEDGIIDVGGGIELAPEDQSQNLVPPRSTAPATSNTKSLPSGIGISFPSALDFAVLTGEFAEEIKKIEHKAQSILTSGGLDVGDDKNSD